MRPVHKYKSYGDYTGWGQTQYELHHTTECGYVRDKVTLKDDEVTCKLCLREMKKHSAQR